MNVAVFGGTGYIGSHITEALIARGHHPVLLARQGNRSAVLPHGAAIISGDIKDTDAVAKTIEGASVVIYCIGIIREYPRLGVTFDELHHRATVRVIDTAEAMGARRFILMSANGVRSDGTPYQRTKYLAEERLRNSALRWTIFRPSVVFGDPRGRIDFCTEIRDRIIRSPLPAPLFFRGLSLAGAGAFRLSPVHVGDVAGVFAASLDTEASVGGVFPLGGPVTVDWRTLIATVARASGIRKTAVPAPAWPVLLAASLFGRYSFFPATRDQLAMLIEGNECGSEAFDLFGIEPRPFSEAHLGYLRE